MEDLSGALELGRPVLYGYLGPQLREIVHEKEMEGGGPWN